MIRNNFRQLGSIFYSFANEVKRRKNFVNIAKMIKQEEQGPSFRQSDINLKSTFSYDADKQQLFESQFQKPKAEHMSADDHKMNHRIKTAIRCETIYYELRKNKHKLEMKHYALMLCKLMELRRINKIPIVDEDYMNFLKIIEGKIEKMPPEQLVRIVHGMKHEGLSRNQLRPLMPIIESIIKEFCNTQNNELEPASFQTLRLSTSIKLFHSLCFILQATGSHYQAKIKQLLNQTLDYIIFRSMKTKKISKSGEYFPASLKFSFLEYCQTIGAKTSIVKGLILGILVQKQKLSLDQLLDLQRALFGNAELLQKTRNQLFSQKDIHIKYNILYRIEKYISQQTPSNLKKSSNYSLLTKKLVEHLERISQLSFEQLNILEMGSSKDEAIYKTLSLFHQAYKNCLIQNFNNLSQKDDAMKFYRQSQNQYALYELLKFFYLKLKKDGVNALRPSTKKQLKEFVNFLCKFYSKLNFLTQSIIIEILVMSNFNGIKPILTQFLEVNTFAPGSIKNQRAHFLKKDKQKKVDKFFEMLEYEKILRENCPVQFQVFMKSNIKNILKFVFKQNDQVNIEKYAYYLAQYCKALPQSNFTSILQLVIKTYEKISWQNRAFNKDDVNTIYKNQDYFLSSKKVLDIQQQLENQSDIFGKRLIPYQKDQLQEIQKIIPTLQSDKQFLKFHFDLENRIRQRIRKLFRNFKFVIIFLANLKLNAARENLAISINEDIYVKLLQNFKTELECLKFEPLLTKENCSEIIEIHQFLKDLWSKTTSDVQVTNEFAIHANESQKLKKQVIDKKEEKCQQNKLSSHQNKDNQKNQNQAQQEIEDEEQSEESEYTEEVTYLKGKDVLDLQVLKYYKNLQQKSQQYFSIKNKEILNEIFLLTSEFTQLPKESVKDAPKIQSLLKKIKDSYFSSLDTKSKSFVNLTSVDDEKVRKQNLIEVLNLKLQSKENRQIYALKVYKKTYPSLKYFGQIKNKSQEAEEIYYVNFTKSRKNIKQKKESKINEIPKDSEENQKV